MASSILLLSCLAGLSVSTALDFHDDFEAGLNPAWRVLTGAPEAVPSPGGAAGKVLELDPGAKLMLPLDVPVQDLAIEARVRFAEKREWIEAPFLLRANDDGSRAIQVYLEQCNSQVIAVRYGETTIGLATAASPVRLTRGPWYTVKIVAIGQRIGVWVNAQPALAFLDREPVAGGVGLRVGDARTQYDDVTFRAPTEIERDEILAMQFQGAPVPEIRRYAFALPGGGEAALSLPDVARPLVPFEARIEASDGGAYTLSAGGRETPLDPAAPATITLAGIEGAKDVQLLRNGKPVGTAQVALMADTTFDAGDYGKLFDVLRDCIRAERQVWPDDEQPVATNPSWVRDHVHEMKGYKFWERDLTSYVDALIDLQRPDGFFYEILGPAYHDHQTFVTKKHVLVQKEKNRCWIRLEMEADVEYLMVEGAYQIWQATGDLDAMRARLPHLERGIEYCFTDPTRWDPEHGALKRTFSIDTWDFTYGISDHNRRIEPGLPMGIMHGDNSGLYQACRQLSAMYRATDDPAHAVKWNERAESLRERINKLCFNGRYYTHQILLQPVDTGVKEEDILSLSNAYDINRGLPTHEMAVSIIDEYQARRKLHADTQFAEWFSIDPPYPQFGPYPAGRYINGGICGFVAGELAKAAFAHGREDYAVDILNRVDKMVAKDGTLYFLYDAQGKDMSGGPRGWGAAAVISAMIEGLAGIHDDAVLFRTVTISPRFMAAGLDHAYVCARYGPSGAYLALAYDHDPVNKTIQARVTGNPEEIRFRLLLPPGVDKAQLVSPADVKVQIEPIENARYLVCNPVTTPADKEMTFVVKYRN